MDRRTLRRARALARLKVDAIVGEAWAEHVRGEAVRALRVQENRRDQANRDELLAILAELRRRGWTTR